MKAKTKRSRLNYTWAYVLLVLAVGFFVTLSLGRVNQYQDKRSLEGGTAANRTDRVVTTSVSIAEILDSLEVPLVGVPSSDNYSLPARYHGAKQVGPAMSPDAELLRSIDPTLLLSPLSLEGSLKKKYDAVGVEGTFVNLNSVEGMFESIEELGNLLGRQAQAKAVKQDFETYMREYQTRNHNTQGPRVLVLMGLPGSYLAATDNSYVGSLVKLAGGANVYGDRAGNFAKISTEDMLKQDPDIILLASHGLPDKVSKMFKKEFEQNDIWKHFDAVKSEKVFNLDHQKFGMSARLNYKEALNDLEKLLYPSER